MAPNPRLISLALVASTLLFSGCQSQTPLIPITVGHISSQDEVGQQATRAIDLALDELNKVDEKQRPIQVRHTDAQGKLDAFAAEAVRLATVSDAVALIGGTTAPQVEQLDRGLVPVIGLCGMRTPVMGSLVFLTDLSPECRGDVAAKFVTQELKAPYVLEIVDQRDEEAKRISAAFTKSIAKQYKRDEPLQHKTLLITSDGDITRAAERIEKTKPDAAVFAGKLETLAEIQRNLAHPVPIVFASPTAGAPLSRFQNDVYTITAYAADDSVKSIKKFRERFQAKFSTEPDETAALAYDAVRLLAKAARETTSFYVPEKLAEAVAAIKDFPGVTGTVSFAGGRQLRRPAFILRRDGSIVKRYTAEESLVSGARE